jgi:hypothetical protein
VDELIIAGDVGAGDVIELPGTSDAVVVKRVRLGQGGFILTVAPVGDSSPEAERMITLTTRVRLRKQGHQQSLPGPSRGAGVSRDAGPSQGGSEPGREARA